VIVRVIAAQEINFWRQEREVFDNVVGVPEASVGSRFGSNLLALVTIGQSQSPCWDCLFLMRFVA
jgi:hypothetical protein